MIVLDTNLLYELSGIEGMRGNFASLLSSEGKNSPLAITSVSIVEAISKFRTDFVTLRKALSPLWDQRLIHVRIGYLPNRPAAGATHVLLASSSTTSE